VSLPAYACLTCTQGTGIKKNGSLESMEDHTVYMCFSPRKNNDHFPHVPPRNNLLLCYRSSIETLSAKRLDNDECKPVGPVGCGRPLRVNEISRLCYSPRLFTRDVVTLFDISETHYLLVRTFLQLRENVCAQGKSAAVRKALVDPHTGGLDVFFFLRASPSRGVLSDCDRVYVLGPAFVTLLIYVQSLP
jgi:hypothetical protein